MFSLSFLVALTVFVSADLADTSVTKTPSLLEMIRNDPNALLSIFATADKDTIEKITQLLGNLYDEGVTEIQDIDKGTTKCKEDEDELRDLLGEANGKLQILRERLQEADKEVARTEGVMKEAGVILRRESPILTKEINVFSKVVRILNRLLNNGGKDLNEEDSVVVRAFISFADQADHSKVKKIIAIVTRLHDASFKELEGLKKAASDAEQAHKNAEQTREKFNGQVAVGKAAADAAKKAVDNKVGECEANLKIGNNRKKVINTELTSLQEVVHLLGQIAQ